MTRYKTILGRVLPVILLLAIAVPSQAASFTFTATLSGPNEAPPNGSLGTGFSTIVFNNVAHTLSVNVAFSGLSGTTTMSHIHCCTAVPGVSTAGVATETPTFGGFPLGVTFGTYSNIYNLTLPASYNAPFLAANGGSTANAEAALLAGALGGTEYLNIHTSVVPGGEIRGFLVLVPETSTVSLLGIGIVGILGFAWRRRLSA